jgi:hypothetical protein
LLAGCGGELECFYDIVRELAAASPEVREERLSSTETPRPRPASTVVPSSRALRPRGREVGEESVAVDHLIQARTQATS